MKRIFFAALAFVTLAFTSLWACFNDDPGSNLNNNSVTITDGDGGILNIVIPGWGEIHDWEDTDFNADVTIGASFPYTLNLSFSGFVNDDGSSDTAIKRLVLFYYSKNGEWTVLQDIKNPSFNAVTDVAAALFGRHCIPSALGYTQNEVIPVVPYFATASNESFDLQSFLTRKKLLSAAESVQAPRIALVVQNNRIAH